MTERFACGILRDMETTTDTHTILDLITSDEPAPLAVVEQAAVSVIEYPPLTQDEETFALAVIECSGNISAAYRMVYGADEPMPLARGKALLAKPAIALKIRDITDAVQEASLISVGAHLDQLAKIRDLSVVTGQLKVAYQAERSRGEAVGIYQKHDAKNKGGGGGNTAVQINVTMASKHDANI